MRYNKLHSRVGASWWLSFHISHSQRQSTEGLLESWCGLLTMVAFIIKNLIDPINLSKMLRIHNQIQISSDASEKNLTLPKDTCKPRTWSKWRKHFNSQLQWPIIGLRYCGIQWHNSVCHGDKSDECMLFHQTGSISSDKSRSIGFLISGAARLLFPPIPLSPPFLRRSPFGKNCTSPHFCIE